MIYLATLYDTTSRMTDDESDFSILHCQVVYVRIPPPKNNREKSRKFDLHNDVHTQKMKMISYIQTSRKPAVSLLVNKEACSVLIYYMYDNMLYLTDIEQAVLLLAPWSLRGVPAAAAAIAAVNVDITGADRGHCCYHHHGHRRRCRRRRRCPRPWGGRRPPASAAG